jgi:hypothetical protein
MDVTSLQGITLLAFKDSGDSPAVSFARPALDNLKSLSQLIHHANADMQINGGAGHGMQMISFAATASSIFDFRSSSNVDLVGDSIRHV